MNKTCAISSSISLFRSRPKCPEHDRRMQLCSFLTLLVEQTKLDNRTLQDCGVC